MSSDALTRAQTAFDDQRFGEARLAFEEALEETSDDRLRAGILQEIASILRLEGDPGAALTWAKRAEAAASNFGITRELAGARLTVGNALADMREYPAAQTAIAEAARLFSDLGLQEDRLQALIGLARLYGESNDNGRAQTLLTEILAMETTDRIRSQALNNLAILAMKSEEFEEAEAFFDEDLAICRRLSDRHGEMVTSINLGRLCEARGRGDEAQTWFTSARSIAAELNISEIQRLLDDRLRTMKMPTEGDEM